MLSQVTQNPAKNPPLLLISNDELLAIHSYNERQLEQGKQSYPYLSNMHLVGKLTGQKRLYDYWAIKCLADTRFNGYIVPTEKRTKHGIIFDNATQEFQPTRKATANALERFRLANAPTQQQRPNALKFDPADIVEINTPLPDFLKIGTWTAPNLPQNSTLSKPTPTLENKAIEPVKVVDSLNRQKATQSPPNNPSNLSDTYGLTAHQFYKNSQVDFANSLLPKNHPIRNTMKQNTGVVRVYGDNDGIIYTTGGIRTRNPYSVFDNVFDGQKANEYARLVQAKIIEQGYNLHKVTLNYPHHNPDITTDLPLLNRAKQKYIKELQRQVAEHLPRIDLSMRLVALENPLNKGNGYNSHYHIVFILKHRMTASEKRKFKRLTYQTWLRALRNTKLIDKTATPEFISDVKFNDSNALSYVTKYDYSYHLPQDIDEIEQRWLANKSISIFELITLAKYERIPKAIAQKHYRALLVAMFNIEKVKYSKALNEFCIEHGLLEPIGTPQATQGDTTPDSITQPTETPTSENRAVHEPVTVTQFDLFSEPETIVYKSRRAGAGRKAGRKYDPEKQLSFAPLLESLLLQAIERAKRPKRQYYRRINDTDYSNLPLLVEFNGKDFAEFAKSYQALAVLNRIRDDYRAGKFKAKPDSYWAEHPRPS